MEIKLPHEKEENITKHYFKDTGRPIMLTWEPEETVEEVIQTLQYAHDNFDSSEVSALAPYPGTELFDCCEKNNLFIEDPKETNFVSTGSDYTNIRTKNISP